MSLFSTRKKLPCIHSAWVLVVHLLVGVPGPMVIVPSAVQFPAIKSSFLSSGAGVGGPICACIAADVIRITQKSSTASDVGFIDLSYQKFPGGQIIGESQRAVTRRTEN